VEFAHGVLENEADGAIGTIFGQNVLHEVCRVLVVLFVIVSNLFLDDPDADDFVAVIHELI
jgi:hypothetical protein